MSSLYIVDEADFVNIATRTGFSAGNVSSHMAKLEAAGYVSVRKAFVDRRPRTTYSLTEAGRLAFDQYRATVTGLLETGR